MREHKRAIWEMRKIREQIGKWGHARNVWKDFLQTFLESILWSPDCAFQEYVLRSRKYRLWCALILHPQGQRGNQFRSVDWSNQNAGTLLWIGCGLVQPKCWYSGKSLVNLVSYEPGRYKLQPYDLSVHCHVSDSQKVTVNRLSGEWRQMKADLPRTRQCKAAHPEHIASPRCKISIPNRLSSTEILALPKWKYSGYWILWLPWDTAKK